MEERHIHLFSNAQSDLFENNQANNFTNEITPPLRFGYNEEWEVALQEVSCVNTIQTIPRDIQFTSIMVDKGQRVEKKHSISKGVYTAKELISALNEGKTCYTFKSTKGKDNANTVHVGVTLEEGGELSLDPLLADILALDPLITTSANGNMPMNLKAFSYNIVVYMDCVQESMVGGKREKILRVIPFNSEKYLSLFKEEFKHPMYVKLIQNNLDRIRIEMRTDYGEFFPIRNGRTYMKLHFRRVR